MRAPLVAALVAAALVTTACGETYVETSATTAPAGVVETTLPAVDADAPLDAVLAEIEDLMFDLDERIIDQDDQEATLARIEELWAVAEADIRAADPDDVFNFEQAIDLARSGVERRRPADASKGYKIFVDVADAYLAS